MIMDNTAGGRFIFLLEGWDHAAVADEVEVTFHEHCTVEVSNALCRSNRCRFQRPENLERFVSL